MGENTKPARHCKKGILQLRRILCLFGECVKKEREQFRSNGGGGGVLGKTDVWNKHEY